MILCDEDQGDGGEGVVVHLRKPLPEEYSLPSVLSPSGPYLSVWDCDISLLIGLCLQALSHLSIHMLLPY